MCGIRPPDCFKLAKNSKHDNDVIIFQHNFNVKFFWGCFVSLVKFSLMTGSGIMTLFFYKGLTRNPEIGSTHVQVFPNIWRLGQVMDTIFGTNVSNRMLLNAAKFQGYSFYRFWVIKGKPTEGLKLPTPLPPRLGLSNLKLLHLYIEKKINCLLFGNLNFLSIINVTLY